MTRLYLCILYFFLLMLTSTDACAETYWSGDVNADNKVSISDVTRLIDILLKGKSVTPACDANIDNKVSVSDVLAIVEIILGSRSTLMRSSNDGEIPVGGETDSSDVKSEIPGLFIECDKVRSIKH